MSPIKLVVSDVDGTLVTSDKRLSEGVVGAVARLRAAGIAFTVTSSRPPVGMAMLVGPLGLDLPMGAYNGAALIGPDLGVLEEHLIPAEAARRTVARLAAWAVGIWVFADARWWLTDPAGDYVDRERRTIGAEPAIVAGFGPLLDRAAKIVGVSRDVERLARCEAALQAELGPAASVARSQAYYLDVTPPGVDKGTMVAGLAARLGIPLAAVATVGDAGNDVAMFAVSGLSVAMGNAPAAVKARAGASVAATNDEDGFAEAVARFILPAGPAPV